MLISPPKSISPVTFAHSASFNVLFSAIEHLRDRLRNLSKNSDNSNVPFEEEILIDIIRFQETAGQ